MACHDGLVPCQDDKHSAKAIFVMPTMFSVIAKAISVMAKAISVMAKAIFVITTAINAVRQRFSS